MDSPAEAQDEAHAIVGAAFRPSFCYTIYILWCGSFCHQLHAEATDSICMYITLDMSYHPHPENNDFAQWALSYGAAISRHVYQRFYTVLFAGGQTSQVCGQERDWMDDIGTRCPGPAQQQCLQHVEWRQSEDSQDVWCQRSTPHYV